MSGVQAILLLGHRDDPTDGVVDYCDNLQKYGATYGLDFEIVQVQWAEKGWRAALGELREAAATWRDRWVLLQYTTLAWSRRGFPLRAPHILDVLRNCGVRPGVVFHDLVAMPGKGIVGNAREYCHLSVLRKLYERSDLAVFTLPLQKLSWLPMHREKATFIPVGANCPELPSGGRYEIHNPKTIAVYGVTGGTQILLEVADIAYVVKQVCPSALPLRIIVFGRGSREAESALRRELAGVNVEIETLGLVSPEQVTATLARADVLLFVRGQISSRRGSAIAGIACGLPIVCYSGPETDWPITEAGILAVPSGDRQALAGALENVLSDAALRSALAERSRNAQQKYFSWQAICGLFLEFLKRGARN
jgi:glycosyltransferase involved in cell wall biosynthesis